MLTPLSCNTGAHCGRVPDDVPITGYEERTVLCDPRRGITEADAARAIKLLNGQ